MGCWDAYKLGDRSILPMKSRQEIFDIVAVHLLTQNEKSSGYFGGQHDTAMSMYRGRAGNKCAIGYLISDEDYVEDIEGGVVSSLFFEYPELMKASGLREEDTEFLRSLQIIHDCNTVPLWYKKLDDFAKQNNLDASCLEQFPKTAP